MVMFEWNYDRQMSSKMASPTPNVQNEAEVKNRHGRSGPLPIVVGSGNEQVCFSI